MHCERPCTSESRVQHECSGESAGTVCEPWRLALMAHIELVEGVDDLPTREPERWTSQGTACPRLDLSVRTCGVAISAGGSAAPKLR